MSVTIPHCTESERRRKLVDRINETSDLNGIEHIEFIASTPEDLDARPPRQRIRVHFFSSHGRQYKDDGLLSSDGLYPIDTGFNNSQILIRGRRPKPLTVVGTEISDKHPETAIDVLVTELRDAETYTLQLVKTEGECRTYEPLDGFDPRYATTRFTWRKQPNTDVDTQPPAVPVSAVRADAEIDYLARDYASLRRLLLDRLTQIMPEWRERNPADIGITLVELLAWVGDRLAYRQDAVGTEAYLGTARQRVSVRRHTRLVDYRLREGCNARVLMQLTVEGEIENLKLEALQFCTAPAAEFRTLSTMENRPTLIPHIPAHQRERFYDSVKVFQPVPQPLRETLLIEDDLINAERIVVRLAEIGQAIEAFKKSESPRNQLIESLGGLVKVWQELRPRVRDEIQTAYPNLKKYGVSEHLKQNLVDEFNRLITEERLRENAFDGVITPAALALGACHAEDADFAIQNRKFLDDVFAGQISSIGSSVNLYQSHNEIHFYTWDEDECWLPAGATLATLRDEVVDRSATSDAHDTGCTENVEPDRAETHDPVLKLSVGDILIFEEIKGPKTGNPADANPAHRHAVRLTRVCQEVDSVPNPSVNVVEIEWSEDDALPFPMCLSATTAEPECCHTTNISVARGNIVLADHGRTVEEPTSIPGGGEPTDRFIVRGAVQQLDCGNDIQRPTRIIVAEPFAPWLSRPNLTFIQKLPRQLPASKLLSQDVESTLPAIHLTGVPGNDDGTARDQRLGPLLATSEDADTFFDQLSIIKSLAALLPPELGHWLEQQQPTPPRSDQKRDSFTLWNLLVEHLTPIFQYLLGNKQPQLKECTLRLLQQATRWLPRYDLVDSTRSDRHFVVELDNQRRAFLRFGDDQLGSKPTVGTQFYAKYRIGNGEDGNIGAQSLLWFVSGHQQATSIASVRNPMAAAGGRNPQSIQQAKLLAPHAYRENQPRAITADDYTRIVLHEFGSEIQNARADITPAAGGKAVTVAIDLFDSVRNVDRLQIRIQRQLHRVRSIGHHVHVVLADYVPLDIALTVTVNRAWRTSLVRLALAELFSNRVLAGGQRGLFHPDNVTFGNDIHKSNLVAEAQSVAGVDGVEITTLGRVGDPSTKPTGGGTDPLKREVPDVLVIAPLEIARLDNNGNASMGRLCLKLEVAQ